ncbi:MAG: hypothetical protein ACR2O0_00710 [Rhizobiaceae bacterium]
MNPNSRIPDSNEPDQGPRRIVTEAERAAVKAQHWSWIRFIFLSALDGMAIGALVAIAIIRLDLHGVGTMMANSNHQTGYTLLLIGSFAHTFSMVVCGSAIWLRSTEEDK